MAQRPTSGAPLQRSRAATRVRSRSALPADDERGWQSIGRALTVLDAIGEHLSPVSLTDISAEVKLTISTTHRILRGLEARAFVQRDPLSGDYSIGPSIMRLARSALAQT